MTTNDLELPAVPEWFRLDVLVSDEQRRRMFGLGLQADRLMYEVRDLVAQCLSAYDQVAGRTPGGLEDLYFDLIGYNAMFNALSAIGEAVGVFTDGTVGDNSRPEWAPEAPSALRTIAIVSSGELYEDAVERMKAIGLVKDAPSTK